MYLQDEFIEMELLGQRHTPFFFDGNGKGLFTGGGSSFLPFKKVLTLSSYTLAIISTRNKRQKRKL